MRARRPRSQLIFVTRRRAARRMKHAKHRHVHRAGVFERVTHTARQVDTRARLERRAPLTAPHSPFACDNEDFFFVGVMMHWRTARWNYPDELSHAARADILIHQKLKGSVAGRNR